MQIFSRPTRAALIGALAVALVFSSGIGPTYAKHPLGPVISTQPHGVVVAAGKKATFKVRATGGKLKYQWYSRLPGAKWKPLPRQNHSSLSLNATKRLDGTRYRVRVSNPSQSTLSRAATLGVATQPKGTAVIAGHTYREVTVKPGTTLVARVDSASGGHLRYEWAEQRPGKSFRRIVGATASSYRITAAAKINGNKYRATLVNAAGSKSLSPLTVRVMTKPRFISQPTRIVLTDRDPGPKPARIRLSAAGEALSYHWQRSEDANHWSDVYSDAAHDGMSSLPIPAAEQSDISYFRVKITNSMGSATSSPIAVWDFRPARPGLVRQSNTINNGGPATIVTFDDAVAIVFDTASTLHTVGADTRATVSTPVTVCALDVGAGSYKGISYSLRAAVPEYSDLSGHIPTWSLEDGIFAHTRREDALPVGRCANSVAAATRPSIWLDKRVNLSWTAIPRRSGALQPPSVSIALSQH